ncbi:MAG: NAD(P)H-dependent oxidoreductase [Bacteroidales bacterium]|nr:NAD(P)H-dependent oxidoreductase [Bacteroidales bacterium]
MMKKLFYVDACMREGSNTKKIADAVIEELSKRYDIECVRLSEMSFPVVDDAILKERSNGYVPEEYVAMAKKIAAADRLVIAAPFWDMSFPSALKVFLENMSLFNITFNSNEKECYGLCKAEKVLYITTRGMDISTGDVMEQATPYIKALSRLWGLGELSVISAQNMDYSSEQQKTNKVNAAIAEGLRLCERF